VFPGKLGGAVNPSLWRWNTPGAQAAAISSLRGNLFPVAFIGVFLRRQLGLFNSVQAKHNDYRLQTGSRAGDYSWEEIH
jgi:hypothetical protein